MKVFLGVLVAILLAHPVQAQKECASTTYQRQLLKADRSLQQSYDQVELHIASVLQDAQRDTSAAEVIRIPVVVHVLFNNPTQNISDEQIQSQLTAMNADFRRMNADRVNTPAAFQSFAADARIEFCLAKVDPQGRPVSGINRKSTSMAQFAADDAMKNNASGGISPWDSKRYLNIWICNLGGRSVGYATLPGGPADKDGVVIAYDAFGTVGTLRANFDKGRTATHEIGHWLGLNHLWGDNECGDDHVDDTPRQRSFNFGCPNFPRVTTCSPNTTGDMFMNYMDFTNDACMNMFTKGQVRRMRALFAQGGPRNSFLGSRVCEAALAQGAPLPAGTTGGGQPATPPSTEPAKALQVQVYPNPVRHSVQLVNTNMQQPLAGQTLQVFDMVGSRVYHTVLTSEKQLVDLSFLKAGVYSAKIGSGSAAYVVRLVKM